MVRPFLCRAGDVLRCDFHGLIVPEMVKVRDVVVVAPHHQNRQLVTIIPLSTTAPETVQPYHYKLPKNPRPGKLPTKPVWAKCDMLYTLSTDRLSMYYERTRRGGRRLLSLQLPAGDFDAIRRCVAFALNLPYN